MHIYRASPGSLSTSSVAIQLEVPRQMQIGPSLFGAQNFLLRDKIG